MKFFTVIEAKYLQNCMKWFMVVDKIKHNSKELKASPVFATPRTIGIKYWTLQTNSEFK